MSFLLKKKVFMSTVRIFFSIKLFSDLIEFIYFVLSLEDFSFAAKSGMAHSFTMFGKLLFQICLC